MYRSMHQVLLLKQINANKRQQQQEEEGGDNPPRLVTSQQTTNNSVFGRIGQHTPPTPESAVG